MSSSSSVTHSVCVSAREGFKNKKIVEFSTKRLTPPPLVEKNIRTKNYLLAMKHILYDMGQSVLSSDIFKAILYYGIGKIDQNSDYQK